MAIRLSTLAEIKVLSLSSHLRNIGIELETASASDVRTGIAALRNVTTDLQVRKNGELSNGNDIFKTIGIARNVRVDEDYGTTNIYGIGAPTRPRIVPNNYSANVTAERLQLDRRDLDHFITKPEFWYSDTVQRDIGITDILLYTFFFVKSKEDTGSNRVDIFALMPRTSSRNISNGDVMVAHNVNLVGFKYSYEEAFFDLENLVNDSITEDTNVQA